MVVFRCDGCGKEMHKGTLRYTVDIDIRAAYDEIEISLLDLARDHRSELRALIERLRHREPSEIEEQVYKKLALDLCPACQKAFLQNPLRFHPEQGGEDGEINIDGFLRSLGYGENTET